MVAFTFRGPCGLHCLEKPGDPLIAASALPLSFSLGVCRHNFLFGMTPIGTPSRAHHSWLWARGNKDFPPTARTASRRIQSLHTVTGFRVFLDPAIQASSVAQDFTALAVHMLDAMGFFRCPSHGPVLYEAVHELDQLTDQGGVSNRGRESRAIA